MIARGAVVRIGPAYDHETRARTRTDEITGVIGTVVAVRPHGDLLLVRGVYRGADVPPADEWQIALFYARCSAL